MSIFFGDEQYGDLLSQLVNNAVSRPEVYEEVYSVVIKNQDYVLYGQHPKEIKRKAIESLISYFEKTEEYERCIVLNELKRKL